LLDAWGRFVYRHRWWVLLLSVLCLVLTAYLRQYGGKLGSIEFASQTEAGRTSRLINEQLPSSAPSYYVIFTSDELLATDPRFAQEMQRALEPLRRSPDVLGVRTPYDGGNVNPQFISKDKHSAYAVVELRRASDERLQDIYRELHGEVRSSELRVIQSGTLPALYEFQQISSEDLRRAEVISFPASLIMLLLVFGSVVAAAIPLGTGLFAIVGALTGTLLLARYMNLTVYSQNIVTMLGLALAIDYSLFIVSRFREEINGSPIDVALGRTLSTAGRAVLFSGITVAIGMLGMTFFRLADIGSIGVAGTVVVVFSVFYAFTLLPAILAILGRRVNSLRVPFVHPERRGQGNGYWHRLSMAIMRYPWQVLVVVGAILLLLGVPFLHIRLALSDINALPKNAESRRGVEMLRNEFPGGDLNPIYVVLKYDQGSPLTPERIGQLYDLTRWLEQQPDVVRVQSLTNLDPRLGKQQYQQLLSQPVSALPAPLRQAVEGSVGKQIVVVQVYTDLDPNSDQARDLVRKIRSSHPQVDGEVLVTGQTAYDIDSLQLIEEDVPKALAFILVTTYVALFLLLGSVFLPIKAFLMNVLSLSASYGALVWIFQEGHLSGLLDFHPGPINSALPVILFCALFGLSMDYEVLLLSRIKEEYERTGDNTLAVATGLEKTGRIITGAALIMITVFVAFTFANTLVIKSIGLGMAIAVFVDAAIVRTLLVPATMRLLGQWNWWAPGPLARFYRRFGISAEGEAEDKKTFTPVNTNS